ncbi:uncharacterized protein LOC118558293 [Fundulus heteroclitus]|uniref:uncharacterized protein LOC118558293 n=1 Tax=Fundulus heteroclitus TaxID=8078 RepID=UPI00165BB520|nr:uncharacterized protein LOC118558293 [Fundulus heteroclitus]
MVDGYDWWYKNLQQHKQYKGRTEMKINYKSGDFSLTLKNPTDRDSGTYSCTVYKSGTILAKKEVLLKVKGEADSLIMAIDFGSAYSGYAFNLKPREEGGETQLKTWGKEVGLDSPKTPTCILFDKYKRFLKFGYEAKTAYSNMRGEEAKKYYFFEDFKRKILNAVSNIKDLQPELLLPWILLCPLCPDLSSHLETVSLSELSESLQLNSDPSQISSYSQKNRF